MRDIEVSWTKTICREMQRAGALIFPIVSNVKAPPGWPDRLVVDKRWTGLIEFKGAKTPLSRLQRVVLMQLRRRAPRNVVVVRKPDRIEDQLGCLLQTFDGSGLDLLETLRGLE